MVKIYHEQLGLPIEIQAAWLHHAFTQIHPFQDGNGRVARALASLVLIKGELLPFLVFRVDRSEYISGLEAADQGELAAFIEFIRHCQRISIFKISNSLTHPSEMPSSTESSIDDIIGAIEFDLILKDNLPRKQWLLDQRINQLNSIIYNVLNGVMGNVLGRLGHGGHIRCEVSNAISNYLPTGDFGTLQIKSGQQLQLFRANKVMSLWFSFLVPEKLRGLAIVVPFVEFESAVQESLGEFFLIKQFGISSRPRRASQALARRSRQNRAEAVAEYSQQLSYHPARTTLAPFQPHPPHRLQLAQHLLHQLRPSLRFGRQG